MTTPRRDPYELLIQQFLQNVQQGREAVEGRFQGQRQERLIGEERDFQTGLIEEERAVTERRRQEDIAREARERQEDLALRASERAEDIALRTAERTEDFVRGQMRWEDERSAEIAAERRRNDDVYRAQAVTAREQLMQDIRAQLQFIDPNSPQYEHARRVLESLLAPIPQDMPGWDAYQNATRGVVVLGEDEVENVHTLIGNLERIATAAKNDDMRRDALRASIMEYLADGTKSQAERQTYYNEFIAKNDELFNDDMRRYLLAAVGINDKAAQDLALANLGIAQATAADIRATTALRGAQRAEILFGLEQGKRLADLTYQEAQNRVAAQAREFGTDDVRMFLEFGIIPSDPMDAEALARRMRYDSVEELQRHGEIRWKQAQRRELADLEIAERQADLFGENVNLARVERMVAELAYSRDVITGAIRDKVELSELAYALALTGDTDSLAVLEALSLESEYASALGGIQFGRLVELAEDVRLSDAEERELARLERRTNVADQVVAYQNNRSAYLMNVASTFSADDYEVGPDGEFVGLDDAIRQHVDGFSAADLRTMGVTADQLASEIRRYVMRDKVMQDRSTAVGVMEALLGAVPFTGERDEYGMPIPTTGPLTDEQQAWKQIFMTNAALAGLDDDVAEMLADGALRSGDFEHYKALMDVEFTESQIAVNLANARRTNLETGLLEDAQTDEGVILDSEMYTDLRQGYESMIGTVTDTLQSAYCTEAAPVGGDQLRTENAEECTALVAKLNHYEYELRNLTHAYATGSPYSYGLLVDMLTVPQVRSAEVNEIILGWGDDVRTGLEEQVITQAPQAYALIVEGIESGEIASAEDYNADLALAAQQISEAERAEYEASTSIANIDFGSEEWRNMSDGARLGRLARSTEWQQLAAEVAGGRELTTRERHDLALQFGWHTDVLAGRGTPNWLSVFRKADVEAFSRALDLTIREYVNQRDSGALDQPSEGVPGGPAILNGEINPALMNALIVQESGGAHRGGGIAATPEALTESVSGALGLTQIMPITGWQPGHNVRPIFRLSEEDNAEMVRLVPLREAAQQDWWDAEEAGDLVRAQESRTEFLRLDGEVRDLVRPYAEKVPETEYRRFANDYLQALLLYFEQRYPNDDDNLEKALAAYNAGAGTVNRAVGKSPGDWMSALPQDQTRAYVPAIMDRANGQ